MTIEWSNIGPLILLIGFVVGIATAYIRFFIANELHKLEKNLFKEIGDEFCRKEIVESNLADIKHRLEKLELRRDFTSHG